MTRTLFLAWQDPHGQRWYPIGRLRSNGRRFVFVYTQGALEAQQADQFPPLAAFPDLRGVYQSDSLFPLFTNRLMRASRADYPLFLQWLGVPQANAMPLVVLARGGGRRATDTLEVFSCPEELADGSYETWFFPQGFIHVPKELPERAERLVPGERLLVTGDCPNVFDSNALALRTSETSPGGVHVVGYCPRFLRGEILRQMTSGDDAWSVTVERVNLPPAPMQFRVLCRLQMKLPSGVQPFGGAEYQPLVKVEEAALQVA